MAGIETLTGRIAVLPGDDVDTDRIIPARFLSRVERAGYGELLFHDWRRSGGFPLDDPAAVGATLLVVGSNFGCGSSREHAVWAIQQAGFVGVIAPADDRAPAFSDIFRQNAANCGLLLVELSRADHARLAALGSGAETTVDLPNQTVRSAAGEASFEIAPASKAALIAGHDLIGTTLEHAPEIAAYEGARPQYAAAPGAGR